jgi:2-dehydro-3-deoxyphosphogluconate aldolase/(4S)-4-hydroxy-2-oxoglutarate aldolase
MYDAHNQILAQLVNPGLIPVIRADDSADVLPICEALVAGGVTALEITMTTPNALNAIREVAKRFLSVAVTGAGSVTSAEICRAAIDAGAVFIVTPIMRPGIAKVAKSAGCAVILGAFSPTEAQAAYEAGADFVKIFPAETPAFVRALRAPLPHLKVIPTGGVSLQTVPEFLAAGCVALGVGSQLLSKTILREKNWPELTRMTREYIKCIRLSRKPA